MRILAAPTQRLVHLLVDTVHTTLSARPVPIHLWAGDANAATISSVDLFRLAWGGLICCSNAVAMHGGLLVPRQICDTEMLVVG